MPSPPFVVFFLLLLNLRASRNAPPDPFHFHQNTKQEAIARQALRPGVVELRTGALERAARKRRRRRRTRSKKRARERDRAGSLSTLSSMLASHLFPACVFPAFKCSISLAPCADGRFLSRTTQRVLDRSRKRAPWCLEAAISKVSLLCFALLARFQFRWTTFRPSS